MTSPDSIHTISAHLSDGDLLALLDGETPTASDGARHLATCAECGSRSRRIGEASAQTSRALLDIDALVGSPPPLVLRTPQANTRARSWSTYASFAAATAVLLAVGVASAAPTRAWIARHLWIEPVVRTVPPPRVIPTLDPPTPTRRKPGMTIAFAPTDTLLTVRFTAYQSTGSLKLTEKGSSQVSAFIITDESSGGFFVAPGELRIRNAPEATADYEVTVPSTVRVVRIVVGDDQSPVRIVGVRAGLSEHIQLRR